MRVRFPSPASRTFSFYESLIQRLDRFERLHLAQDGVPVPAKPRFLQAILNPVFLLLGRLISFAGSRLSGNPNRPLDRWFLSLAAGRRNSPLSRKNVSALQTGTLRLKRSLEDRGVPAGRTAVLILTSHPPAAGPDAWKRFELMAQGMEMATLIQLSLRPNHPPRPPRCVLALDPFALNTTPLAADALYAGLVYPLHLTIDRMPALRRWEHSFFTPENEFRTAGFRLARELRNHQAIVMAHPGAVPHNARLLYGVREFLWESRRAFRLDRRGEKLRTLEWVDLIGDAGSHQKGELSPKIQESLRQSLGQWGLSSGDAASALQSFRGGFSRDTPPRPRLFHFLTRRIAMKGTPLIIGVCQEGAPGGVLAGCLLAEKGQLLWLDAGGRVTPAPSEDVYRSIFSA